MQEPEHFERCLWQATSTYFGMKGRLRSIFSIGTLSQIIKAVLWSNSLFFFLCFSVLKKNAKEKEEIHNLKNRIIAREENWLPPPKKIPATTKYRVTCVELVDSFSITSCDKFWKYVPLNVTAAIVDGCSTCWSKMFICLCCCSRKKKGSRIFK